MLIANIRFLIIMGVILTSAITFFIWCCKNSMSEYQKMSKNKERRIIQ